MGSRNLKRKKFSNCENFFLLENRSLVTDCCLPPTPSALVAAQKHDKESTDLRTRSSRNAALGCGSEKVTTKSDHKLEIDRFKSEPAPSIEELFQNLAPIL